MLITDDAIFGAVGVIDPMPRAFPSLDFFDSLKSNISSPPNSEDVSRDVSSFGGVAVLIVPLRGGVGPGC